MTYPAPWQAVLDSEGVTVFDADGNHIVSVAHSDVEKIALWHRIVDAINAQERK